ncbi:helix-turn-helix transcriptional regulator [Haloferula luteola]|nr:AraC family transcriptional regulator [Haloferula luteola]
MREFLFQIHRIDREEGNWKGWSFMEDDEGARRSHVVRADDSDHRPWLAGAPVCGLLAQHHIAHVEVLEAISPFQMMRQDLSGTFLLACVAGGGRVLVDGKWLRVDEGQACLLPPFVTHGLRAEGRAPWISCCVRYQEARDANPMVAHRSPILGEFDPDPLLHAIRGLHAECLAASVPAAMHLWLELIQGYVLRFAQPHQGDSRLWRLWEKVQSRLGDPWTLDDLADQACLSKEHLRKLCHRELGRTPMQHVTFLRMQKARELLSTTEDKVEVISRKVGFANPFTFSNTFQKWMGWRPSRMRRPFDARNI